MADVLNNLSFSVPEMISLVGLIQCVYILVYIGFRAGDWKRVALPFAYFLVLAMAVFVEMSCRFIVDLLPRYRIVAWVLWFMGPLLSAVVLIWMAAMTVLTACGVAHMILPWPLTAIRKRPETSSAVCALCVILALAR